MALQELLRALEAEAGTRVEEILARGRGEAAAVRERAEAALAARRDAELGGREVELRAAAARALEAARREAARRVLEARAAALDRIRRCAEGRLAARAVDPACLPRLRADLGRALEFLGDAPAVVEAGEPLLEDLRRAAGGRPGLAFAASPGGGLVLRAADGSLVVDASYRSRLERAWPALAIELARRLEAEP